MGSPARISVRNCWLNTRNVLCFSFRRRRIETPDVSIPWGLTQ